MRPAHSQKRFGSGKGRHVAWPLGTCGVAVWKKSHRRVAPGGWRLERCGCWGSWRRQSRHWRLGWEEEPEQGAINAPAAGESVRVVPPAHHYLRETEISMLLWPVVQGRKQV